MGKTAFAAIWSSDLPRAEQTAQIIAEAIHLPVQVTDTLRERSFGKYEGATAEEIQVDRTALGLAQTGDLADWTGMPGIESTDVLWERRWSQDVAKKLVGQVREPGCAGGHAWRGCCVMGDLPGLGDLQEKSRGTFRCRTESWRFCNGELRIRFYLLSLVDMGLVVKDQPTMDTATMSNVDREDACDVTWTSALALNFFHGQ